MVLVELESFAGQYEELLQLQRTSAEKEVNIYVSTGSCDALCAAKILVVSRVEVPCLRRRGLLGLVGGWGDHSIVAAVLLATQEQHS